MPSRNYAFVMENKHSRGGFLSSSFFDSKCRKGFPDKKEKILGYLIGPVGAQLLYFLIQTWLNVY